MRIIKGIINRIRAKYARSSSERYCLFLRSKGVFVGTNTHIDADTCLIDLTRPSLVSIGNNCYLNRNFTLLTHDYVSFVFVNMGGAFINSSGKVTIGNNVSFGHNVTVLKGVTIGDNTFIGAGSIVTKDIPANSVAVGTPCKVIMSIKDYYKKRLEQREDEAIEYARSIQERFNRRPNELDFWEEYPLFVTGDEIDDYPALKAKLGSHYRGRTNGHVAKYKGLNDFLERGCKIK